MLTGADFYRQDHALDNRRLVIDEQAVPSIDWQPVAPRVRRLELQPSSNRAATLPASLFKSGAGLEREDTVMGFSDKQLKTLQRNLDHRCLRTRHANGR